MNHEVLLQAWRAEEAVAHIHGWDFSHIDGRYEEETNLPWDYRDAILSVLKPEMKILDIDTGGGEFLLSLHHPYENTAAMENYGPNVQLCRETLLPLGVDFRPGDGDGAFPFGDESFDLVINRHGDLNAREIFRVLKPGGTFITQQVGAENDRELVELLLGPTPLPFPEQYLSLVSDGFSAAGFEIMDARECFSAIRFFDVGALVWFARIIEWEFPGFSVETCRQALFHAQEQLERDGCLEGKTHRFFLMAKKG
ncbi:MAG: class I SAM-dependent methyltransferase [Ruminococcaceae bacterium]|nr:class I SAM-dependent methyltransferase [Oscillospiraceae bacterium]